MLRARGPSTGAAVVDAPEAWKRSAARRLSDEERIHWLRLIRSDNVGPRTFRTLLHYYGSARAAVRGRPAVAIGGSRNASAAGAKMAGRLARELGDAGFAIVSGLARGIDAAAHRGSLATGTIAVLAGGLDRIYPPEHADLLE